MNAGGDKQGSLLIFRAEPGDILGGRFRLVRRLGQGSFGEVWQAVRLSDGMDVALKIPKDQELGEEQLRREPKHMQLVQHRNVVTVYGWHSVAGVFVIEMEFVEGRDLGEILDGIGNQHPLSFAQTADWIDQLLCGLEAVHNERISHGDIKPQNVLISNDNIVKITDFGTSRRLEDVWAWTRRQGTEVYWAPEVVDQRRGLSVSDIYSVGVVLYEMVTGDLPYQSPIQLYTTKEFPKPRELNKDVPPTLEACILKAMAFRPEARYQSCAEFRTDIRKFREQLARREDVPIRTIVSRIPFRPPSSSPLFYLERAKERLAKEDYQGALEAAEAAVERSDGHPNYLRMLGGICMRLGYHQKALETYERLLAVYERGYPAEIEQKRDAYEYLGNLYVELRRYEQAVIVFKKFVEATASSPYARFKLAIAYGLNGEYRRAIELLEGVRKDRPDAVIVYSKLGWAHAAEGNIRQAISYYNQALVIDGSDLFSLFELGKYYWIIGEKRRAREYFERLASADRENAYLDRVQQYCAPVFP